ncbi:MAG: PEP-CTERM sorting domain-containing protein, partial [Akkermansiaceae bacterium]|nr:PEP-CTERM sorting domain-containing protein [Akkermansiaceae bacterium]
GTAVDTTAVARTQNNWSGANGAGLGQFGGNFAAGNGSNQNLAAIANLEDTAEINLNTGLRFWAGTDAQFVGVPEPSSIVLLGFASLFVMRRRR